MLPDDFRPKYPIFVIEKIGGIYTGFKVVRSGRGFITFGRIPIKGQFVRGKLFSSDGSVAPYSGDSGSPRFSKKVATILEMLILPSIVTKFLEFFIYFPPIGDKPPASSRFASANLLMIFSPEF